MAALRKHPLRAFHDTELEVLKRMAQCQTESAVHVERAKALLGVAEGRSFADAARLAGRKSPVAISHLVEQFNREGLQALELKHGGGHELQYAAEQQKQILKIFRTPPDRKRDGTATWSLNTLQARLRKEGMKKVSTFTIWKTLHEAGMSWQKNRTWMDTGKTVRMRKKGPVEVEDIDRDAKKNLSRRLIRRLKNWA
jgi:transposase